MIQREGCNAKGDTGGSKQEASGRTTSACDLNHIIWSYNRETILLITIFAAPLSVRRLESFGELRLIRFCC